MATAGEENELKQQGAVEAAKNEDSSVTADDAQKKILEESKKAGVAAFTFQPDASPEEKKAQARAAVPEGLQRRHKAVAIATDIDDGSQPDVDLPPPSKEGAVESKKDVGNGHEEDEMAEKTGWTCRLGWPDENVDESLVDQSTWLEGQLPDRLYGDWYHNCAVVAFACLSSWLVAVLGGGLGWVFIVMAGCATYYRTSIRRVRRNFRDDIAREMAMKRIETDTESLEWINCFMVKFWPIYQPVLAQTVINSVDQVLSSARPAFLDSLKLKTFTLGSKPPRMEHVKTYPKAEDDLVIMDWKFSFTPNDTNDMTSRQIRNRINPKVVLEIRIGKAMISKGIDVIVEDMAFSGIMRLKLKLQIPFPHVERVDLCFLERPTMDYSCKPLGGASFDINFIPGLESFILQQIHGNLAPMMYAPNVFPIEVAKMLAGTPVDQAIGVVAITLYGAQGLRNPDNFSGTPDPYVVVSLNRRAPLAQTKTIKENANPRWNETHYVIITSYSDSLDLQVYDYNEFRKDKELGVASFQLENVEEVHDYEKERLELIADGKPRGVLICGIRFFPVLDAPPGAEEQPERLAESNTGILRFSVEQAKDLDGTKSLVGLLNPYATLLVNGKEMHQTKKLKRTNNPIWDNGAKEMLITDRNKAKLGVAIKDDRDMVGDQLIGTYQIKLDDMLELMAKGQEWYNLSGVKTGRVKMMARWKPVAMAGLAVGTGGYVTPVGVMRFHFKNATDLRNFETLGKSDPYVRVVLSGLERARTVTFKNNLNPEWDEVLYVPVHSAREHFHLEVMDAENVGRDRSLGLVEVFSGDYMSRNEDGQWRVHDTKAMRQDSLRLHGKGVPKGLLCYTVSFYPCINVADPEEEAEAAQTAAAGPSESKESPDLPRPSAPGRITPLAIETGARPEPGYQDQPPRTSNPALAPLSPKRPRDDQVAPKVHLTPHELLQYESGLVIFRLMEADLPRSDTRIEIFVDDMAFPSYVSSTAKHKKHDFDEIGDCFIRELDFSKLTIKICDKSDKQEGEQHTLARLQGNTLDTLKQCLNNPTMLKMKDDDGRLYSVKLSLKYIPVQMQLEPSESINNMGTLRVDVLDAADLPSADRNGTSDPYVKFELNGQDVFKTKVIKKTLSPAWNEFFQVPVPSRTAAKFRATVWDWDFADRPDYLGAADINVDQLDPFKAQEMRLALDGKSGSLRLRLLFRPDYVVRTRQGTSTFSGTFAAPGRIVTGVAGAPVKGVTAVGHGVGKGASFLKRGIMGKKKDGDADPFGGGSPTPTTGSAHLPILTTSNSEAPVASMGLKRSTGLALSDGPSAPPSPPDSATPPGPANGGKTVHGRRRSVGASSVHSALVPAAASGTAIFTVLGASGFAGDVYVTITQMGAAKSRTVAKTKHHKPPHKFDETFKASCAPDMQFKIEVKEHHTLSSDASLGEGFYFVDESGSGQAKEIKVGSGSVTVRSSFVPHEGGASPHVGGVLSLPGLSAESSQRLSSGGGGLRKSFLSKREPPSGSIRVATASSREATPANE